MQTIELNLSGMTCGACAGHVTRGLQSVAGVQSVVVDLAGARARVTGESLDVSLLKAAVEEEGHGASEAMGAGQDQAGTIALTARGCSCCG